MLEQAYEYVTRDFGFLLRRHWLRSIDTEIWKFTEQLDLWLHELFLHPTPGWREHLDAFLEEQAAAGFTVTPESRQELVDFLEGWASSLPQPEPRITTRLKVELLAHHHGARQSTGTVRPLASKEHPQRRPPPWAGKKPTLSDEEALFNRKLAEADGYLDDIDRLLQPIARKVDAAKTDEDLDLNSEVDEIEALIFSHNDAMESARAAWLKGDLGRDTFDRLMLARSPASLGLPMFANDAQAKRAGLQWKKIGTRLKERIAFLDNVILAMQVMEVAGDLASLAFGGTVLLKAFKVGGKIVLVKTVAKTVAAGAVSYVAGKVVEAGLKAAGVSEETISGVQHAAQLVTWLLLLRKIRTSLPNRPKPAVPSTAPITSPTPKAPPVPKTVQPAAPRGPLKNQSGDPEIAAQKARTQPYPGASRLPISPDGEFKMGKHGDFPSPRPNETQSHHGVMSKWMETHFPGYSRHKAPAILMPTGNHIETIRVFNSWRAQTRRRMGGEFDWNRVSKSDIRELSERMFDAARVPAKIRGEYWAWFDRMVTALSR